LNLADVVGNTVVWWKMPAANAWVAVGAEK
jgi:hypothetical protein